jgi:hypothetical protein
MVQELSRTYTKSALEAKNQGFSKSSQDLIATAMLAATNGQEFDFSALNEKDRKEFLKQV